MNFQNDTRAVAPVIGFILIFGFLTIAFIGYQAEAVPQQNAETEFEHFQENRNELVELRSDILTAGSSDRSQYPTIELGTNYQTRILALNGPPPSGVLQTSGPYPITISDGTTDVGVETRFLEYQPGYFQLDIGSTWYENSVLYLDETESNGERVIIEDQQLVTDGDTLRITALQNEFQRTGTDRITLELYSTSDEGNIDELADDEELTVELPTRLGDEYWKDQFESSDAVSYKELDQLESGVNQITLTVETIDNLKINTIGLNEEPTESSVNNIGPLEPSGNGDGGSGNNEDDDTCDLQSVSVSNIVADGDDESQTFTFCLESDLQDGDEIDIDLDDPQSGGVNYPDSNQDDVGVDVDQGSGSAEIKQPGDSDNAELTYTASGSGDSAGTVIEVTANEIIVDDVAGEEYEIFFDFESKTIQTTFGITENSGSITVTEDTNSNIFSTGSITIEEGVEVDGNVGADRYVELEEESDVLGDITSGDYVDIGDAGYVDGDVEAGGEVTLLGDDSSVGGNIEADGSVELVGEADVPDGGITSGGDVDVGDGGDVGEDVIAGGEVTLLGDDSSVGGNIEADGSVELAGEADVPDGGITSGGDVILGEGSEVGEDVDADGTVELGEEADVLGDVTSRSDVTLDDASEVGGDVDADGTVELVGESDIIGDVNVESGEDIICSDESTISGDSCEEYVSDNY